MSHTFDDTISHQYVKETKRTYDKVRIKNPNDPEQYIDVKRPTKITTAPEEEGSSSGTPARTVKYARQKESATIEILERDIVEKNPDYMPREGTEDI